MPVPTQPLAQAPAPATVQPVSDQPASDAPAGPASAAAPHPLDGSQFHNVIDEQVWSELPPTADEQQPRRANHLDPPASQRPHPDEPQMSVGTG